MQPTANVVLVAAGCQTLCSESVNPQGLSLYAVNPPGKQ